MQRKFTIEEIKNYLLSKDSMGDILYYLSESAIDAANENEDDDSDECDYMNPSKSN